MVASGAGDLSAERLTGAGRSDLDPEALDSLRVLIGTEGRDQNRPHFQKLMGLRDEELLENLEVIKEGELTWAGIVMLGRSTALARWIPQHEIVFLHHPTATTFDDRHNLKGPLILALDALEKIFARHTRLQPVQSEGFSELAIPDLSWRAVREAVLNALVHRDWFVRQSVQIDLYSDRLIVFSPGGFIGGVTPENVLRHGPVRRNTYLADLLEKIGLVNRAGMGVDRMYEDLLRFGKGLPRFDADETSVQVTLALRTNEGFARFVARETREGRRLDLDELILLRGLSERGVLDRWSAAALLQLDEQAAGDRLASLRERGLVLPEGRGRGTSYRLASNLARVLRSHEGADSDVSLDEESIRRRVQALIVEHGRATNADIRQISGYSRAGVLRLMRRLREEGLVTFEGRGRAAHFAGGPQLRKSLRGSRKSEE